MNADFSRTLALLRQEKEISQRKAAADLGISQALLSHYENGVREPGLAFVKKACDYYHVSADYLLGRTLDRDGGLRRAVRLERREGHPARQHRRYAAKEAAGEHRQPALRAARQDELP